MKEKIRLGYIGLGRRGYQMMKDFIIKMKDVEVRVVCDLNEKTFPRMLDLFKNAELPLPETTTSSLEVASRDDIDAVMIMTGWDGYIRPAIEALRAGKYTAIEVGCAYDLSECFELLEAHKSTGAPLMMLENICYGRRELMATRMT